MVKRIIATFLEKCLERCGILVVLGRHFSAALQFFNQPYIKKNILGFISKHRWYVLSLEDGDTCVKSSTRHVVSELFTANIGAILTMDSNEAQKLDFFITTESYIRITSDCTDHTEYAYLMVLKGITASLFRLAFWIGEVPRFVCHVFHTHV